MTDSPNAFGLRPFITTTPDGELALNLTMYIEGKDMAWVSYPIPALESLIKMLQHNLDTLQAMKEVVREPLA